ncbi:MAG TPA: hypothetical protein VFA75_00695 [Nevskia sp.]|nr:hypothetical protein [Nevskia sp.]
MRIGLIVAGLILAGLGVAVLMGKFQYTHQQEVVKIGDVFSANVAEKNPVPQWAGIAGLVVGGLLVLGGALKKA